MGGRKARQKKNPTAGGPTHGSSGRRSRPQTTPILFRHESRGEGSKVPKCSGNTFGYIYPSTSDPVEIKTETEVEVPTYSYHPAFSGDREVGLGFQREEGDEFGSAEVSHLGLGFVEKEEEEEEVAEVEAVEEDQAGEKEEMIQKELDQLLTPEMKKGGRSEGFLSIGGYRVYTEDTSSPEEDMDDDDDDDEDDVSGDDDEDDDVKLADEDEKLSQSDVDDDEEDDDSEMDDSSSEIDDEIVQDYMDGIGGADEFLSGLSKKKLKELEAQSESDNSESKSESESESDEDGFLKRKKLGGVRLMEASEDYGMKRQKWKGKGKANVAYNSARIELLTLDNVVGLKDCRSISKGRKSAPPQLSRSWPGQDDGRRGKNKYRSAPGTHMLSIIIVICLALLLCMHLDTTSLL